MLHAAFSSDSVESDGVFKVEFDLISQKVFVMAYSLEKSEFGVEREFLSGHFSKIINMDVEDIEFLLAKIGDMLGRDYQLGIVVIEGDILVYGVVGGSVYMKKNDKGGYVVNNSRTSSINRGELSSGTEVVLGVGNGKNNNPTLSLKIENDGKNDFYGVKVEPTLDTSKKLNTETTIGDKQEKLKKLNIFEKLLARRRNKTPEIYVKSEERQKLGYLALAVFLILIISIGLGWKKRQTLTQEESFAKSYEPALNLLIDAEKQSEENSLIAREKLLEAKKIVEESKNLYDEKSSEYEKLTTLAIQIEDLYSKVSGEETIEKAEIYYDLNLVKEGMFGEKMAFGDGWLVVLDKSRDLLVGIETEKKQAKVLAGGDIMSGSEMVAASTGKAVVKAKAGLVGVYFGDRETEVLITNDEIWKGLRAIGMFGGNVYLVDGEVGEVWQYPGLDGGLGSRKRWFGPGVLPDLSTTTSISVDGDIWLGMNGDVQHYRRGAPMRVVFEGLATPLEEVISLFVEYEKEDLWVLDRTNKRVVVFSKEGNYKRQYIWEGIASVSDMVVIEQDGKQIILLLSGSSIYQIPAE